MVFVDEFRPARFLDSERGFLPSLSREEFENRRRVFTERAMATLNTGDIEHALDITVGSPAHRNEGSEYSVVITGKWKSVAVCALLAGGVSGGATLYGASSLKQTPSGQPSVSSLRSAFEINTLSVQTADPLSAFTNDSPMFLEASETASAVMDASAPLSADATIQSRPELSSMTDSTYTPKRGEAAGLPHGPPGLDGSSNAPSSVNSEPSHAPVCESQRPINLLGYSPSSESLTSAGVSPHALMTWINETLHTSNQFTALWLVVAALALTMELCAGLVRGLRWCCRGNASDFCSVVWRRFLPDKPESGEALLGMRAQLDAMDQQLRERAGMMDAQKGTIKLIEGELQRSMDAENALLKENHKLKRELRKVACTPRGTPVDAPHSSPPRDPVTAVLHTKVEDSKPTSPNLTPKPRSFPMPPSRSPSTRGRFSAPPVPTPPLPTLPGPSPPRPGPRPSVPPTSFSPLTRPGRNSGSPGAASTRSQIKIDRELYHPAPAALVGVVGRSLSDASTCIGAAMHGGLSESHLGSPVSEKSIENPLL